MSDDGRIAPLSPRDEKPASLSSSEEDEERDRKDPPHEAAAKDDATPHRLKGRKKPLAIGVASCVVALCALAVGFGYAFGWHDADAPSTQVASLAGAIAADGIAGDSDDAGGADDAAANEDGVEPAEQAGSVAGNDDDGADEGDVADGGGAASGDEAVSVGDVFAGEDGSTSESVIVETAPTDDAYNDVESDSGYPASAQEPGGQSGASAGSGSSPSAGASSSGGGSSTSAGASSGGGSGKSSGASASAGQGASSEDAPAVASEESITVSVYVDSSRAASNGWPDCLASTAVAVPAGSSVYDALKATGLSVGGSGGYVASIAGLAERACGSGSGWLYYVNGTSPGFACNKYVLYVGEDIRWVYTCDMGNDV